MTNGNNILEAAFRSHTDQVTSVLAMNTILDIGTIVSIEDDGTAVAKSSQFIQNTQIIYRNAEIIYPGNDSGVYASACAGTACLIFIPLSCMPDISDKKLRLHALPYDRDGVKVMPIGNGSSATVKTLFDTLGNFFINSKSYQVQFAESSIDIQGVGESTISLSLDQECNLTITRVSKNGCVYESNISGIGVRESSISDDGSVRWDVITDNTGAKIFTQINPSDPDHPLFQLSVDNTGKATVAMAADLILSTKGNLSLTAEGDMNIEATGALTITGDGVNINDGNLTVDKQ